MDIESRLKQLEQRIEHLERHLKNKATKPDTVPEGYYSTMELTDRYPFIGYSTLCTYVYDNKEFWENYRIKIGAQYYLSEKRFIEFCEHKLDAPRVKRNYQRWKKSLPALQKIVQEEDMSDGADENVLFHITPGTNKPHHIQYLPRNNEESASF